MNLSDELRTHIDRIAPPVTVAEVTTRSLSASGSVGTAGPTGRSPVMRWLVVAAALAVTASGAALLVPRAGGDGIDRVSTDQTVATLAPVTVGAWEAIPSAQAFPSNGTGGAPSARPTIVTAVTAVPGGYVAVGASGRVATVEDGTVVPPDLAPTAWTSPDGRTWTERPLQGASGSPTTAGGAGYSTMTAVGSRGDTVVAAGSDSSFGPAAWRWEGDGAAVASTLPFDNPSGAVTMAGVAATSRAFVIVGTDIFGIDANAPGAVAWASVDDGATWTRAATFAPDVVINSVTAYGDRLVAVGSTGGFGPSSAAWFSDDDGRTWQPATLPASAAGTGGDGHTELVRVAAGDGRLLAYSTRGTVAPGGSRTDDAHQIGLPTELTLWASDDGATWRQGVTIDVSEPEQIAIWRSTLTWGPAGFLLTISPVTQAWVSADGTTATDTRYAPGDFDAPWLRASVGTPDGYIAIGDSDHGSETIAVAVAVLPVDR